MYLQQNSCRYVPWPCCYDVCKPP